MSNLQTLQQRLLQAVLADRAPRLRDLCGDNSADTTSRLAIYRNGYRIRLRDALGTEYPGLGLMAGRRFGHLLESYIETHPSGHYNIRWHGAGLAAFLEYGLPWRDKPELADMARLDWAISTAFDATDEPTLSATALVDVPAESWAALRLRSQSHLQILASPYNVDAFRRAADGNKQRPRLRHYDKPRYLLVWRQLLTVRYRLVEADELSALTGATQHETFAQLCERLTEHHDPSNALPRMAALLRQWLDDGLISGWELA
ncbi:DNA-binding domain-containing protein [Dyella subtropica]|uniref:HvfC/BufC N-terminal domain-containing protein n=1 Tax=Dyella subtropica TaxID=2992127 RepID=UPI0022502197|nr:DNA-binding domain-containing protein [Dyella subtropica]